MMNRAEYEVREKAVERALLSEGAKGISLRAECQGDAAGACWGGNAHESPEPGCFHPEEHHLENIIGMHVGYFMALADPIEEPDPMDQAKAREFATWRDTEVEVI